MLVISRKAGQQVRIGDQITVTILKTQGKTVRVGIEAPRDLHVLRAELPPHPDSAIGRSSNAAGSSESATGDKSSPKPAPTGRNDRDRRRMPETKTCAPRSASIHPQRWTVASMRERVHGQTSPRSALASGTSSWSDVK